MAIKVIATPKSQAQSGEFPKLMQSDDGEVIVLAAFRKGGHMSGTILETKNPKDRPVGKYSGSFGYAYFVDYHGSITLES